jgi:hypothetical protein
MPLTPLIPVRRGASIFGPVGNGCGVSDARREADCSEYIMELDKSNPWGRKIAGKSQM